MKDMEYRSTKLSQLSHVTIEQAADGIFWLDSEGRIHRVNDAACRLLGYSREELLAMTVPDLDPEYSVEDYKERYWRKVRQLGTIKIEESNSKSSRRRICSV
jgi:PAS domain S-box-containing protein